MPDSPFIMPVSITPDEDGSGITRTVFEFFDFVPELAFCHGICGEINALSLNPHNVAIC